MPELPEVESYRQSLDQVVTRKEIANIEIFWSRIVETDQALEDWVARLRGQVIQSVGRRGKYLVFNLSQDILISHLRMEGKYFYYPGQISESDRTPYLAKHTHVKFYFADGSQLHYHDVRKFGRIKLLAKDQLEAYWLSKKLGPEPLTDDFILADFQQCLAKSRQMLKPYLLSQEPVVGLGNIYVDESLFQAGIHPSRRAYSLTDQEAERLYHAIRLVLSDAVAAGGTRIRTYDNAMAKSDGYQDQLLVYGRQGQTCPKCGQMIEKIQMAQRGTHYCPNCQPLEVNA